MFESEDTYWWFVGRRALAITLLEQHLQEGAKLLDVGCGTGAGLKEFAKRYDTFGVDMSPLALEFSSGRGIPNLFLGDGQKLPVAQESFDGVISLDTIEHIPDDRAAFAEIYRLMKPGDWDHSSSRPHPKSGAGTEVFDSMSRRIASGGATMAIPAPAL